MAGNHTTSERNQLRRAAKARRQARAITRSPQSEVEWRRLRHELEVHQLELEIQNEELRRSQAENEAALERFTDFYDFAPVGYFDLSGDGTIRRVNLPGADLLGIARGRLLGRRFHLQLIETDRPTFDNFLQRTFATKTRQTCEIAVVNKDRTVLNLHLEATLAADGRQYRLVAWNITERKQAEAALRQSEERFKAITDFSPDIISIFDVEGRLLFNSAAAGKIHGYQASELEGRSTFEFIHPDDRAGVADAFGQLLKAPDAVVNIQYRYRNADGSYKWMEAFGRNELTNPHIHGIISISRDITERKRAEAALQESNEMLSLFMKHSPIFAFIKELTPAVSRVLLASDNYQEMLGIPGSAMRGKTMTDLFPAQLAAQITRDDQAVLAKGEVLKVDEDFNGRNYTSVKFPIIKGGKSLLAGYTIDITERKQAEEALRRAHAELEQRVRERTVELHQSNLALRNEMLFSERIITTAQTIILILDADARIVRFNPYLEQLSGYRLSEVQGQNWFQVFLPAAEGKQVRKLFRKALAGAPTRGNINAIRTKDGTLRLIEWNDSPLKDAQGRITGLVAFGQDITERQQAADALIEACRFNQQIIASAKVGIIVNDRDLKHLVWNPFMEELTGLPAAAVLGKHPAEIFPFLQEAGIVRQLNLALEGKTVAPVDLHFHVPQTGRSGWASNSSGPLRNAKGEIIGAIGIVRDITERQQAAEALRRSEERHRVLFSSSRDALLTLEPPSWSFTAGNPAAVNMFGAKDFNGLLKTAPWGLSPEFQPDGQSSRKAAQAMIETALRQGSHFFEWCHRRLDGAEFPASVLLTRVELEGRAFLQATVRDITERVRLEQEILDISDRERRRIAQDLHDGLGQLLFGAGFLTNTLRKDLAKSSEPAARRLDRIQTVINEALAQTRNLARGLHPVEPEPNGLMVALGNFAEQSRTLFRIRCHFTCRRPVMIENSKVATHLFQIAQEAVTNALKHGKSKRVQISLTQTRAGIRLTIKDDGWA